MNELAARLLSVLPAAWSADPQLLALAQLLELSVDETRAIPDDPRLNYRPFTVRKRGGGRREVVEPSSRLKTFQRRLLHCYLNQHIPHHAATAFRAGSSIAGHARMHLGQAIILTVDLADFFPSTSAHRVRAWFRKQEWRGEALNSLMRLCVYRGGLPQGAPTSPALSNLVNRNLDEALFSLAAMHGARYSRYCDDLAFSWSVDDEPRSFRVQVEDCLHRMGYQVQPRKGWRLQRRNEKPEITGLVLDGPRLRFSRRILTRWRQASAAWWMGRDPRAWQRLLGYRSLRNLIK
jgi:hypothetical protein